MKTDSGRRSGPSAPLPTDQPLSVVPSAVVPRLATASAKPPLRWSPRARAATAAILVLSALLLLGQVAGVLPPFIWALVVAYAANPAVNRVQRLTRLPRIWCVAIPLISFLALLVFLLTRTIPVLVEQAQEATSGIPNAVSNIYQLYINNGQDISLLGFRINLQQVVAGATASVSDISHNINQIALGLATGSLGTVTHLFIFVVATFYLLVDGGKAGVFIARHLPESARVEIVGLAKRVDGVLGRYLRSQLLLIGIMTTASYLVLSLLGVRFAIVLAVLAGVLEIFPVIGPFAAITIVSLFALIQPNTLGLSHVGFAALIAIVFFVLRQIEDYFVIPSIVGHVVHLHPLVILFALFCGEHLAGILGMLLAVPLTGALRLVLEYLYAKIIDAPTPGMPEAARTGGQPSGHGL